MARLILRHSAAVVLAGVVLVAAACGGDGGDANAVPCDDAAFRNQSEELYVAIATAQNASAPGAADAVVADLRKGVTVLGDYLDAHPPCADDLRELEKREREALAALDEAVAALEAGDDASEALDGAVKELGAVETALR
jgi:hypothetical protein